MIKIKVLYDSPKDPCKTHWINIWQQYKENIRCNIVRDYRTLILQLAYFSLADFNILYFFGIVLRISCTLSYLLLHLSFPFYHCHYSTADYFRLWIFIRLYILVQLIYVYTLNLWTVWFSVINNTIGPMSEYALSLSGNKTTTWLVSVYTFTNMDDKRKQRNSRLIRSP